MLNYSIINNNYNLIYKC